MRMWVVGTGPGDPKLLTLLAIEVLQRVKVVFAPLMGSESSSRAYQVVQSYLSPHCRVVNLCFNEDFDKLSQIVAEEATKYPSEEAAFLVIGDPTLYSSFFRIFSEVEEKAALEIKIIPGISAHQVMSAHLGVPLAQGEEIVSIIPGTASKERVKILINNSDTCVIYKAASLLKQKSLYLETFSRGWVGENLSTNCEKIYPLPKRLLHLPYFSLALLKKH